MQVLTTSEARKILSEIINTVKYKGRPVAIGRRNKAEVLLIKFPEENNSELSSITNINQYGEGFNFLNDEPELYSKEDLKKSYV